MTTEVIVPRCPVCKAKHVYNTRGTWGSLLCPKDGSPLLLIPGTEFPGLLPMSREEVFLDTVHDLKTDRRERLGRE